MGALGLMMLAAGLLAGTAVASVGLQRATRTVAATARADTELRRAVAGVLQGWKVSLDSLPVGASVDAETPAVVVDGARVMVHARIQRLSPALYAASVSVAVGDSTVPLAMRHARLLLGCLEHSAAGAAGSAVRPLSRWSVTDLP